MRNRSEIIVLCVSIVTALVFGCAAERRVVGPPQVQIPQQVFGSLSDYIRMSYLELFDIAPTLSFTSEQVNAMREYLEQAEEYCEGQYAERTKVYDRKLYEAQGELQQVGYDDSQRQRVHCDIQNLRILRQQAALLAEEGVSNAFNNREAKLQLIEQWPAENQRILAELETGAYRTRKWGNIEDIGFREIAADQQDDIDDGQAAVQKLRASQQMPPELPNENIQDYVRRLSEKIAKNSDLQVPVRISVLNSREINAFALPGGFLFVQRGLLETVEDESELAGVIAHEIAHPAARHGHKLLRKAQFAQFLYQAVRIAGALTGADVLRYTGMGLGLALNLDVLGVSRDFELEADQLGIQYAWKSGYDPTGFIRFFDRMATRKGYVNGMSWFRTHPPFYERMVRAKAETLYLPEQQSPVTQTSSFQEMKEQLATVPLPVEERAAQSGSIPKLENCAPPDSVSYIETSDIESICDLESQ